MKPGDFLLGIIDFLGILVPGAVLVFLQGSELAEWMALTVPVDANVWNWVPALVAAYVLGHFLLGAGVPLNRLLSFYPEEKDSYFQDVKSDVPLPPSASKSRGDAFNATFSYIRIHNPSALAEVERQVAEYKLFRSLTLVFVLDALLASVLGTATSTRIFMDLALAVGALARFLFLLHWAQRLAFQFYFLLRLPTRDV